MTMVGRTIYIPLDDEFKELLRLQIPLKTPIHPRAVPTDVPLSDGRPYPTPQQRLSRGRLLHFVQPDDGPGYYIARHFPNLEYLCLEMSTKVQREAERTLLEQTSIVESLDGTQRVLRIENLKKETLRIVARRVWDPTKDWHTIAMHLAERIERAMRENTTIEFRDDLLDKVFKRHLQRGMMSLLRELMGQKLEKSVRSNLLYPLLALRECWGLDSSQLCSLPLLQAGTPKEKFLKELRVKIHESIIQEITDELLLEEESPKEAKKRKKKKKKPRKDTGEIVIQDCTDEGKPEEAQTPPSEEHVPEMVSSSDDEEVFRSASEMSLPLNGTTQRERNRNAVLCLSIIDSVLDDVFERVNGNETSVREDSPHEFLVPVKDPPPNSVSSPKSESHLLIHTQNSWSSTDFKKKKDHDSSSLFTKSLSAKNIDKKLPASEATESKPHATRAIQRHPSAHSYAASLGLDLQRDVSSQTEVGVEEVDASAGKDGSTTITSALSVKDHVDTSILASERDTYRDMCLTLGAEVSKLKNLLAAQKWSAGQTQQSYGQAGLHYPQSSMVFGPESASHFIFQTIPKTYNPGAMSETGYRADYESQASEDDLTGRYVSSRPISSVATAAGSDISVEYSSPQLIGNIGMGFPPTRELYDPVSLHGMQSRLATDVLKFLDSITLQLRQQENSRNKVMNRMTRLVKAVWPRAQVKLYGSHVTGLCLPSSDLDFVVCLPAVHKNTLALTPGALEGQNAINESSQKLLYRKLKGEKWIDQKTTKLIEHTIVPVIKFSTKDSKARILQLDITFDGPGHHGLEAIQMVNDILEDLPMIRPIVIVLKHFLSDKGLLTAFTGGLSSYCLFLMVARYLQEQDSSWGDCGSLLLGFLDFYGNHFDPRTTGISVRHRAYFPRQSIQNGARSHQSPVGQSWGQKARGLPPHSPASANIERRNSFSDKGHFEFPTHRFPEPHNHFGMNTNRAAHFPPPVVTAGPTEQSFEASYTLDPLLVEDPLSSGNNVGRNAFRIFQIQRAFSDAHRALNAALEWDMDSNGDTSDDRAEYSLLKCLLQSEDTVYDL